MRACSRIASGMSICPLTETLAIIIPVLIVAGLNIAAYLLTKK